MGYSAQKVPFVSGSDTSKAAAESMGSHVSKMLAQIRALIDTYGTQGLTCDEIEVIFSAKHQTISARIKDLKDRALIVDSGLRRLTRSHRRACVYMTPEHFEKFTEAA